MKGETSHNDYTTRNTKRDRHRRRRCLTALARSQAPGCYALILTVLLDRSDDFAKDVWGCQQRIADQAGVSVRTVQRAIQWAEQVGFLTVVRHAPRRMEDGRVRRPYANTYRFCVPKARKPRSPRHDSRDASTVSFGDIYKPPKMKEEKGRPMNRSDAMTLLSTMGEIWEDFLPDRSEYQKWIDHLDDIPRREGSKVVDLLVIERASAPSLKVFWDRWRIYQQRGDRVVLDTPSDNEKDTGRAAIASIRERMNW